MLKEFLETRTNKDYEGDFDRFLNDYRDDTIREILDLDDPLIPSDKKMREYKSEIAVKKRELRVLEEALLREKGQGQ